MRLLHQHSLERFLSAGSVISDQYIASLGYGPINTGALRQALRRRGLDMKREASGYRVIRRPA